MLLGTIGVVMDDPNLSHK